MSRPEGGSGIGLDLVPVRTFTFRRKYESCFDFRAPLTVWFTYTVAHVFSNRHPLHNNRVIVRDDGERTLLFDLDVAIQRLNGEGSAVQVTGVYHNLLRRWAEM